MNGSERRRFIRYEVRAIVELVVAGTVHRCESEDLGAGGCRVALPALLEKGTPVSLRLRAPNGGAAAEGRAVVAWASHQVPCRVGLQFSDELAEQMISFIQTLLGPVPLRTGSERAPEPAASRPTDPAREPRR